MFLVDHRSPARLFSRRQKPPAMAFTVGGLLSFNQQALPADDT